jgi:hypothetical protein
LFHQKISGDELWLTFPMLKFLRAGSAEDKLADVDLDQYFSPKRRRMEPTLNAENGQDGEW